MYGDSLFLFNKNPQADSKVKAERLEKQCNQPPERPFTSIKFSDQNGNPVFRLHPLTASPDCRALVSSQHKYTPLSPSHIPSGFLLRTRRIFVTPCGIRNSTQLGWWHRPINPALKRERQLDLCEFEASRIYIANSRIVKKGYIVRYSLNKLVHKFIN